MKPLDLERCAQEPIHIPGAIQPHGCLLACDVQTLVIRQASANTGAFLGRSAGALLGSPLAQVMPKSQFRAVLQFVAQAPATPAISIPLKVAGGRRDLLIHRSGDAVIVEVEGAEGTPNGFAKPAVEDAFRQISLAGSLQQLAQATAWAMRDLAGFDPVMVYRFDVDDHGEVISEAKAADVDSYLGLHYPESDIPRQARALYLRNWGWSIAIVGTRAVASVDPACRYVACFDAALASVDRKN